MASGAITSERVAKDLPVTRSAAMAWVAVMIISVEMMEYFTWFSLLWLFWVYFDCWCVTLC